MAASISSFRERVALFVASKTYQGLRTALDDDWKGWTLSTFEETMKIIPSILGRSHNTVPQRITGAEIFDELRIGIYLLLFLANYISATSGSRKIIKGNSDFLKLDQMLLSGSYTGHIIDVCIRVRQHPASLEPGSVDLPYAPQRV